MAKRPTAKQLAARKKFVAAVRAGKFSKGKKKRVGASKAIKSLKRTKRMKRAVPKKAVKTVRRIKTISFLKSEIVAKLNDQLKDQLFKRDVATSYKQHKAAQKKITQIRKDLRRQN
jgi:hypothetical protein